MAYTEISSYGQRCAEMVNSVARPSRIVMMQNVIVPSKMMTIEPSGHLNASNAVGFQRQLAAAVSSPEYSALLVDMSQVESLDSAGLMALVSTLAQAQKLDKRFSICCVSPSIRIIFELTQLERVFEIFESRSASEAAIA
jgi:anti-sigma B factor antagonist